MMRPPADGLSSLDDALGYIAAEDVVWTRLAAVLRDDGEWHARTVDLVTGARPSAWRRRTWTYPQQLLLATKLGGETLAEALLRGSIFAGRRELVLPELWLTLNWRRRPSWAPAAYQPLAWPAHEATLGHVDAVGEPSEPLISSHGAPSFLDFHTAAACMFEISESRSGGSLPRDVMYRHQDLRGRITGIRVTDDEVRVRVEARRSDELVVELAAARPGKHSSVRHVRGNTHAAAIPLVGGVPEGAWVLLRNKTEWLDRRDLSVGPGRARDPGVEFLEPATALDVYLTNREGPTVEFKREIPSGELSPASVMKTVAAFSNGNGGSILFGITDDHEVVGLPAADFSKWTDRISQIARDWVDPPPRIAFETLPTDLPEMVVVVMQVEPGTALHAFHRPGGAPIYYVRHNAITVPARPAEIERIVRSRQPGNIWPPH